MSNLTKMSDDLKNIFDRGGFRDTPLHGAYKTTLVNKSNPRQEKRDCLISIYKETFMERASLKMFENSMKKLQKAAKSFKIKNLAFAEFGQYDNIAKDEAMEVLRKVFEGSKINIKVSLKILKHN